MDTIRFEAEAEALSGAVIVRLPAEASARLPSRGQVAVDATVNGEPRPLVVEPDGRRGHWLRLRPEEAADGPVTVELAPSGEWPEPELPDDLRAALDQASDLADTWTDITPMARWEWVRWVNATRNPDTRRRRVEVSVDKLRSGKRRPCCFDLSSCTDPELSRSGKLIG
ncbi:MAG: YdeI/OmpD-associated family protein [Propionicimonas sp.]